MTTENQHAIENAQAWLENIVTMVKRFEHANDGEGCEPNVAAHQAAADMLGISMEEFHDADAAREAIQESALSVEVRTPWMQVGRRPEIDGVPFAEYKILLTTGGPALRLVGELDQYGEPETARLEYQDWGTPWTQMFTYEEEKRLKYTGALLTYARQFYYGS